MEWLQRLVAMVGDAIGRWIRTIAPAIVAYFVAKWPWVEGLFGEIDATTVGLFVYAIYYSAVAALETNVHPYFGWLLGSPKPVE